MGRRDMQAVVLDRDDGSMARAYWQTRSEEERISAVELLRTQCYVLSGHGRLPRISKVIRLVDRGG